MLRFHLEGRCPLEAQDWPACLAEYWAQFTKLPVPAGEQAVETCESVKSPISIKEGIQHEGA